MQNAEGFRQRALEGIKVITYLQEFASAGSLSQLSDLFQDDNRLAEAAVQPCPSWPKRPAQQQHPCHWQTAFQGRSLLISADNDHLWQNKWIWSMYSRRWA